MTHRLVLRSEEANISSGSWLESPLGTIDPLET